ncbi:helix-turn-helix domain-containing protein [Saccharicrinis sp. FJH62]|uniref:helix-turn-helix domain-containing protein n=1 Tax=Saccharicrinis sp. FJH62 TaxID=3344657 RepID=UPI0035D41E92
MLKQPELGERITELRKTSGLTQEELVERCNISVRTLQRIESGKVNPRPYTIRIILSTLDLDENLLTENRITIINNAKPDKKHGLIKTDRVVVRTSVLLITVALLIASKPFMSHKTDGRSEIEGYWEFAGNYYGDYFIENGSTRYLKFDDDSNFISFNRDGSLYNSGKYFLNKDHTFTTRHFNMGGNLGNSANLYNYKIKNDTLRFYGYYLKSYGNNNYKSEFLDEVWIRKHNWAEISQNFKRKNNKNFAFK